MNLGIVGKNALGLVCSLVMKEPVLGGQRSMWGGMLVDHEQKPADKNDSVSID